MTILHELPRAIEPTEWFVVFHTAAPTRLLSWLAMGRFKHVSALAYCPGVKMWLVYDTQLNGTRLRLLIHDRTTTAILAEYMRGCAVIKIARDFSPFGFSPWNRLGFYCVPAIKHLLGVRCAAVRPDGLYRQLLRRGGVRIDERIDSASHDRSEPCQRAGAGTERPDRLAADADAR